MRERRAGAAICSRRCEERGGGGFGDGGTEDRRWIEESQGRWSRRRCCLEDSTLIPLIESCVCPECSGGFEGFY